MKETNSSDNVGYSPLGSTMNTINSIFTSVLAGSSVNIGGLFLL